MLYKIKNTEGIGGYDKLVICGKECSPMVYLTRLEYELAEEKFEGTVLFDLKQLIGDSNARFVSIRYRAGKFDMWSAVTVHPGAFYR